VIEDISRTWKNIEENIATSATETLGLYELKQAKMQWLQDPNQSNVDNLNSVRYEANRHFRKKKREYVIAKINDLETKYKTRIPETCVGASVTLRRVTSLEPVW
jgi:hypothetical protein